MWSKKGLGSGFGGFLYILCGMHSRVFTLFSGVVDLFEFFVKNSVWTFVQKSSKTEDAKHVKYLHAYFRNMLF